MNKIKGFLLIVPVFFSITRLKAQDSVPVTDTTVVEMKFRNSFSISFAPVLIQLMGGSTSNPKLGFLYKHYFKNSNGIRIGGDYFIYDKTSPDYNYTSYRIFSQTDSLQILKVSEYHRGQKFQGHIGYEFIKTYNPLRFYFGVDLAGGQFSYKYDVYYIENRKDTSSNPGFITWSFNQNLSMPANNYYKTIVNFIGLSPFAGIQAPINERFHIQFQIGFDLLYNMGNTYTSDYLGYTSFTPFSFFNIENNGLVNDVSIVFTF